MLLFNIIQILFYFFPLEYKIDNEKFQNIMIISDFLKFNFLYLKFEKMLPNTK